MAIYLIPLPLADGALQTLSAEVKQYTETIKHYFAENVRTARRFLRELHATLNIEVIQFSEINEQQKADLPTLKKWIAAGVDIGIVSEAGCPGIADPGSEIVAEAHKAGVTVIPLTGPNSIILALMASGLNGQAFTFIGYLPVKDPLRSIQIKTIEQTSRKDNATQIFIETPYRNNTLLQELLKHCSNSTLLCIAQNITAKDAYIKTLTIKEWKEENKQMEKQPAVFLLSAK